MGLSVELVARVGSKAGGHQHTWQAWPSAVRAARQCGCSSLYGSARRAAAEPCRTAGLLALAKP